MKDLFKKFLPHLAIIAGFLIITLAYFSPVLGGKVLHQHDTKMWKGSYQEIKEYGLAHPGEQTLWTNSMFGGMPSYQIGMNNPNDKSGILGDILILNLPSPASFIFLMMVGFYILMFTFNVNRWIAVIGAVGFALSTYNFLCLQAGHETKVGAIAMAPWVLAGLNLAFKGNWLWAAALMAAGLGLEIKINHLQITYYLGLICVSWGIAEFITAIKNGTLAPFFKGVAGATVGAMVAVGLNLTALTLTEEYSKFTIRQQSELTKQNVLAVQSGGLDKDYANQWSNGVIEPITMLIPDLVGGASNGELSKNSATGKLFAQSGYGTDALKQLPLYHGKQPFTGGPLYFGAIMIFFFVFSMFVVQSNIKWALFIITLLATFLSMGKNATWLTDPFFDYFPLYNKFRSVTMTMVIGQICIPILATLGLKTILDGDLKKDQIIKYGKWTLYIVGGVCLIFILVPGIFLDFTSESDGQLPKEILPAIIEDRTSLTRMSALRSLVFISLAAGVIWYYLKKSSIKKEYIIAALGLLIAVDLWTIDKKYLNNGEFEKKRVEQNADFPKTVADEQILADKDPNFRVLNFTVSPFNDASTSYYHKSVGGYHGAKFRRYQELREAYMDVPIAIVQQNKNIPPDQLMEMMHNEGKSSIFDMMNSKYYIVQGAQGPAAIYNKYAMGNAWFVNNICWVRNANEEIDTLDGINLHQTTAIDVRYKPVVNDFTPAERDSLAYIKLLSYEPNFLVYESNATGDQFAVFSEIFYDKGWKATIDGKPCDYARVNYVLRGMKVPSGKHKIEWRFDPDTYKTGESIAGVSSILLYLLLFAAIGMGVKKLLTQETSNK
jgi:hypothetical protein